jgi:hypothetical protein
MIDLWIDPLHAEIQQPSGDQLEMNRAPRGLPRHRPNRRPSGTEGGAVHQFHNERMVVGTVDRCDIRVVQRSQHLRFALEAGQAVRVSREGAGRILMATSSPNFVSGPSCHASTEHPPVPESPL